MVAEIWVFTPVVVITNVADNCPTGTVTVAGTVAEALLEPRLTIVPPLPAGPERVTVPVDELPPETDDGLTETDARVAGDMVKTAD